MTAIATSHFARISKARLSTFSHSKIAFVCSKTSPLDNFIT